MRLALALVALLVGPASATPKPSAPPKTKTKKKPPPAPTVDDPAPTDYVEGDDMAPQPDKPMKPAPASQHKEGEYGGVEPGQTPTSTGKKRKAPPKNTLNWVGFEAKEGVASVFFQAATPFEVTQHVENNQLVAELALPRLGPNTWRTLDTRFFDNTLNRIDAKTVSAHRATKTAAARTGGVEVRFTFKVAADAKEAAMRTNTEADGQYYVYLTFPKGTPSEAPTVARPKTDAPRADKPKVENKPEKK